MNSFADMLVFSHLRWSWVYQRPQHLMTRAARDRRVFFVEEPVFDSDTSSLEIVLPAPGVTVVTPHLAAGADSDAERDAIRALLADLIADFSITVGTLWFFTPAAVPLSVDISAELVVYDCMDELSGFAGAAASLLHYERQLMAKADVVFTGGWSLYDAKHALHSNFHAMPSGVDLDHFRRGRNPTTDDAAQLGIPHPRIGYAGVLDERLDLALIREVVEQHPHCQFVFAGPVTKIEPQSLPAHANVHYLGQLPYERLPKVMSGWDMAWMPFAMNSATKYISPTKTPEYLAAGLPVIATPIKDVVRTWGDDDLVTIAETADDCAVAIDRMIGGIAHPAQLNRIDRVLASHSWDALWFRMSHLMTQTSSNAA